MIDDDELHTQKKKKTDLPESRLKDPPLPTTTPNSVADGAIELMKKLSKNHRQQQQQQQQQQ
jgi:hypothetical protein